MGSRQATSTAYNNHYRDQKDAAAIQLVGFLSCRRYLREPGGQIHIFCVHTRKRFWSKFEPKLHRTGSEPKTGSKFGGSLICVCIPH